MEKVLIYLKHHLPFLWSIVEWGNDGLFSLLFARRMDHVSREVFNEAEDKTYSYRKLKASDADALYELIKAQKASDLEYFSPHAFDRQSVGKQFRRRSFLMMGAFDGDRLVGYFFLRFFSNRKCFVGRLIDHSYRGKGIGQHMNFVMYHTAWRMKFRCLSTMSRDNIAVMRAHAKNNRMIVRKELANNFILVEFVAENTHEGKIDH